MPHFSSSDSLVGAANNHKVFPHPSPPQAVSRLIAAKTNFPWRPRNKDKSKDKSQPLTPKAPPHWGEQTLDSFHPIKKTRKGDI